MDRFARDMLELRIQTTVAALEKNNIGAHYVPACSDALELAKGFLFPGCLVAVGGSVTLRETGIQQYIENGDFRYTSRYRKGTFEFDPDASEGTKRQSLLDAYSADVYFCSSNAITQQGELVNVDGQGNRVSAMIYGPQKVVVVAGYNKIVPDIPAALERIRNWAAPANNARHLYELPCQKLGRCVNCHSELRSCCNYTIMTHQRQKHRVNVILVGESLGY